MKFTKIKFIIYCLVILCIVLLPITKPIFFDEKYKDDVTYFFCTNNIDYSIDNTNVIQSGGGSIVACELKDSKHIKNLLPKVYGESIRISNYSKSTLNYILNKYLDSIVKTEKIDAYNFIYCFDETLPNFVILNDCKVNIQIAITENEVNIGYPLILNGY